MKLKTSKGLISVVSPLYNEEVNIKLLYSGVKDVFETLDYDFELVFVDDGSMDGSLKAIEELQQTDSRIKFLSLSRNFGHQVALSAGLDYAEGEAVIIMDSDLQHPPQAIPELIRKWEEGYENVYTVRKAAESTTLFKKYSSQLFYSVFRALTKLELPPDSADFRLLDKKIVLELRRIKERTRFLRALIYWTGFRSVGISYQEGQRQAGERKYRFKNMLFLSIDAITSFTTAPLYIGVVAGVIFAMLGFVYFLYALYVHIVLGIAVSGWASLISLMTIFGGLQFLIIGLIGIYVGKIFEEVKERPLYMIRRQGGFNE
jgi:glycosyltransferase involved in cell wall biosynthesis